MHKLHNQWGASTDALKRNGLPSCTRTMWEVMHHLLATKQAGYFFVPLHDVHHRTIHALVERDWIVSTKDGQRHQITGRGEKAYRVYSNSNHDTRRFDGLCPDCGERPKIETPSGRDYGYCEQCLRKRRRRQRVDLTQRYKDRTCPRCGTRQRHITKSGNVRPYCKPCRREHSKDYRKRYNAELLERIQNGYIKYCSSCHTEPVRITGNTVHDYCEDCHKAYMREYRQSRKGGA